jgi:hypothetical protein
MENRTQVPRVAGRRRDRGPGGTATAEARQEPDRISRWWDKPVSRVAAGIGLLVGVLGLAAAWPETLWPRQVPALAVTVVDDPRAVIWVTTQAPTVPADAPAPDGPGGCESAARHAWAQQIGAAPLKVSPVTVIATPLRDEATVVLTRVTPEVRPLPGEFDTGILLCPDAEWAIGGGELFSREVTIDVSAATPRAQIHDEEAGGSTDQMSLYMGKGEAAELHLTALASSASGSGQGWEWAVTLHAVVNGEEETFRVPEDGYFRIADISEDGLLWTDAAEPHTCSLDVTREGWC